MISCSIQKNKNKPLYLNYIEADIAHIDNTGSFPITVFHLSADIRGVPEKDVNRFVKQAHRACFITIKIGEDVYTVDSINTEVFVDEVSGELRMQLTMEGCN